MSSQPGDGRQPAAPWLDAPKKKKRTQTDRSAYPPLALLAPAIALTIVGFVNFVLMVVNRDMFVSKGEPKPPPNVQADPQKRAIYEAMSPYHQEVNNAVLVLMIVGNLVTIAGGIQMMRRKWYPLGIASSIASMIPCVSMLACCGIGIGIGIWSLVILGQPDIRSTFT